MIRSWLDSYRLAVIELPYNYIFVILDNLFGKVTRLLSYASLPGSASRKSVQRCREDSENSETAGLAEAWAADDGISVTSGLPLEGDIFYWEIKCLFRAPCCRTA